MVDGVNGRLEPADEPPEIPAELYVRFPSSGEIEPVKDLPGKRLFSFFFPGKLRENLF